MFKKTVAALMLAGLASGQAFALNNVGFEAGDTSGWTSTKALISAVASNSSTMTVYNDYDSNSNGVLDDDITTAYTINAREGAYFGLIDNNYMGSVSFAFNTSGAAAGTGDYLWLRLFSAEYDFSDMATGGVNDDFIRVTYSGASGVLATDTFYASQGNYVDSGWKGFWIPTGTTQISMAVVDVNGINAPKVGVDFTAAAPVPEADSVAMMMAGLGVLGMVARRRRAGKAA